MSATPLTLQEVNDRMAALDAKHPDLCARRAFPNGSDYFLEITSGLDRTTLAIELTPASPKRGVLIVSTHEGNEPESTRPLFEAIEALLDAAALAAAQPASAPGAPQTTVTLSTGQSFVLADVTAILNAFDILVVPVANTRGYPNTRGDNSVDPNRDYPVLWKGQRLVSTGAASWGWKDYFKAGTFPPPGWHDADPGLGAAPAASKTVQSIIWLMRKRVQTFVNLQTGYEPNIVFPWGVCDNSATVAPPAAAVQGATDGALRYCSPTFGAAGALMAGATGYAEYMPKAAADRLYRAAAAAAAGANVTPTGGLPKLNTYVGQADTYGGHTGKLGPDPAGGTCTDYFFSLDIGARISMHVECGTNTFEDLDKKLRVKFVTGLLFALLKHLTGLTTPDTTASTPTGFTLKDFFAEQSADWTRGGPMYP